MLNPLSIDLAINNFAAGMENSSLVSFSKFISFFTEPNFLILILLAISGYLFFAHSKKKSLFIALTAVVSGFLILAFKNLFGRDRPLNSLIEANGLSFPSGHSVMVVVFFGILIYLFSKDNTRKSLIFLSIIIVLLVGFARIYLRVHWLSDVLAGFILGGLILFGMIEAYKKGLFSKIN